MPLNRPKVQWYRCFAPAAIQLRSGGMSFCLMEQETVPVLTHIDAKIRDTSQKAAGGKMDTFADLVQLARICIRQARIARTPEVADALRQMAEEYQEKAANLNDGQAPDIDEQLLDDEQREAVHR